MRIEQLSLLATLALAFAALAALVLTGQAGIREDLRALRIDMLAGQAELREEIRAGQAELREEIRAGQAELRKDIRAGQAELRRDMRAGQGELRAGQVGLREEMATFGARLAVVEHRTDTLESGVMATERRPPGLCDAVDCPES